MARAKGAPWICDDAPDVKIVWDPSFGRFNVNRVRNRTAVAFIQPKGWKWRLIANPSLKPVLDADGKPIITEGGAHVAKRIAALHFTKHKTQDARTMSNATKPFPLSQLDTLPDKSPIGRVDGVFGRIFKQNSGTRQTDGAEWKKQDFELKSPDGSIVKVVVWDKDEIPRSYEGAPVSLFSKEQQGKAPSGLYVFDDEYKGKTTRKLKITPTGTIQAGERGGQAQEERPAPQSDAPPSNNQPPADSPPREERRPESNPVTETKKELVKLANLRLLSTKAVEEYIAPETKKITGREMPEDRREAAISSLIIAGERRGLHLNLPARPLKPEEL